MIAIYLGWAISTAGPEALQDWYTESPDRIGIYRNSQNLALREPRDGKRGRTVILCRFPSDNWDFPEVSNGKYLAVEIEYKDSQSSEGYCSRILLDCKVEEIVDIASHPREVKRVVLSYSKIRPAQSSRTSHILKGWKSEWFREKVYGSVPEFHYPDISEAERTNYKKWPQLSYNMTPDLTMGSQISNGTSHIVIKPKSYGVEINGIQLSWLGLERLMTNLARHFITRGEKSDFHYAQHIPPNETLTITVPSIMVIFHHNLGFLEDYDTPRGKGVAILAQSTYMAASHEGFAGGDNLSFSMDEQDDADIHVKWKFDGSLRYEFHNKTDRTAIIEVGLF